MKKHLFYIADVFTDSPFGGNQLAVFPEGAEIEESYYQKIAREINFSETTFVLPSKNPEADFKLRIFTPFAELPMAGHPTIGTSFVLKQAGLIQKKKIVIEEGVGNIPVEYGDKNVIWMNQPLPVFKEIFTDIQTLSNLLSLAPEDISKETISQKVSSGVDVLLIKLNSLIAVRKAKLNLNVYESFLKQDTRSIMIFSSEGEHADSIAHSRFFAPALGISEDPATGSATGPLASFLVTNKLAEANTILKLEQGFEMGRPSILQALVSIKHGKITNVKVGGKSVLMGEGKFYL